MGILKRETIMTNYVANYENASFGLTNSSSISIKHYYNFF
jgi:hypothetical protein